MKPAIPLHNPAFAYIKASDHSDAASFAKRQAERLKAAQPHYRKPASVTPIRAKEKS